VRVGGGGGHVGCKCDSRFASIGFVTVGGQI
jgi:hypothetical protein